MRAAFYRQAITSMLGGGNKRLQASLASLLAMGWALEVAVQPGGAQQAELDDMLLPRFCTLESAAPELQPVLGLQGNLVCSPASFGAASSFASAEAAVTEPADACQPLTNDVKGKFTVITRGNCSFYTKYQHSAKAGATGVVIWDTLAHPDAIQLLRGEQDEANEEETIPVRGDPVCPSFAQYD